MHLHEHIQPGIASSCRKLAHLRVCQRGDNQQYRVRTQGPGLHHLVGVEGEILAQYRQRTCVARQAQILIRALEKIHVGQHREAGGTAVAVAAGNLRRVEVLANHTLARRGLLHLGDHRGISRSDPVPQCLHKAPRSALLGATCFQHCERIPGTARCHLLAFARKNAAQDGWGSARHWLRPRHA